MNIVFEDTTYPVYFKEEELRIFLYEQGIDDENITIIVKRHRVHYWNVLRLHDGSYLNKTITLFTNWIEEDVYWSEFQDRFALLPFPLQIFLFSCLRLLVRKYHLPIDLMSIDSSTREELLLYFNEVLLHEIAHALYEDEQMQQEEEQADAFAVQHQAQRFIEFVL